jgi:hypothetical protein
MSNSDFLTNGGNLPPNTGVRSTVSETVLPDLYTNGGYQIFANQLGVMNTPYQAPPMPRVAGFTETGLLGQAMTKNAATAYQPGLNAAVNTVNSAAAGPGALSASNPYFQNAARSSVSNIGAYMNPYTENVVNRIAELGGRNLSENIMPGIEGRYIGAGQLGGATRGGGLSGAPSGMLTDTARAVRDTNADILGKQYEALNSGYSGALSAAANDLNRMGNIGANVANAASTEMRDRLAAGSNMADLAAKGQELGLAGANAVTGVGNAEMAKNKENLDVALSDWMAEKGYPQEQITNALATLKGVYPAMPTRTSTEGIEPVSPVPTTSTAQDISSTLTTAAAAYKWAKENGWTGL